MKVNSRVLEKNLHLGELIGTEATCRCGWTSGVRVYMSEAREDMFAHFATVRTLRHVEGTRKNRKTPMLPKRPL